MRKRIGSVSVDAGIVLIGDPCYHLHKIGCDRPEAIGKGWEDFCDLITRAGVDKHGFVQLEHSNGNPGLGVVVRSGLGDGEYPVYATFGKDGRIASVTVRFM